jgi:anti-sigma regulatory factor (Ser/Thr protein kinase)
MDCYRSFVEPAEIKIPRAPDCAARARALVRASVGDAVVGESLDTAQLVASELVTNAWKHGEGVIRLRLQHRADRLRLEVVDDGSGMTHRIRPQDGDASGGWGLRLVSDVAADWGCFEGTTHVWAEIALDG